MAEQRESRVWGDQGTEPDPGDETYSGSERPIAEYDNWAMWSATTDIKTLFDWLDGVETDLNNHTSSSSGVHGVGSADVASTNDVSSIQSSPDVSHDNTTGGTSGTPHDHADPDDPVTQFAPGDVADGEVLGNSGGQLASVDAGKSDEEVQDIVATLINAAGNLSSTYDDANDKLTLDTSGLNTEEVQDAVASLVTAGSNLSWSYDDASDTLTVSLADSISVDTLEAEDTLTDPSGTEHTGELADSGDLHARYSDEEAEDAVAAILQGGDKVSVSYDDANETLAVDTSALDTEEVEDAVASLVAADSNLSWSYDDSGDTLTISLADSISVNTLEADDATINDSLTGPAGNTTTDLSKLGGKVYYQETEPSDTPSPPPTGSGGVWYPTEYVADGASLPPEWTFTDGGLSEAVSRVTNETVVFGIGATVYGIGTADGSEQWSYTAGNTVSSGFGVFSIANGVVAFGDTDGVIYGVNVSDGTEAWTFSTGGFSQSGSDTDGTNVYVGSGSTVYAIDITDGSEQWSFATGDSIRSGVVVADGVVYVGSDDDAAYALDTSDGSEIWSTDTGDNIQSQVAVDTDAGVVAVGNFASDVYLFDSSTGDVEWETNLGTGLINGIAIAAEKVIAGSTDNNVYALNLLTGDEVWSFAAGDDVRSEVDIGAKTAIFGSRDGFAYGVNIQDGREFWSYDTAGSIDGGFTVDGDRVFFGSDVGESYRIDQTTEKRAGEPRVSDGSDYIKKL